MNIQIRKYEHPRDYEALLELIKSEGDEWKEYLLPKYEAPLKNSITYVAFADEMLCGYVRSIDDYGMYIWVVDLLVHQKYRGHSIGQRLMEYTSANFPGQDTYVVSDVDEYYEKLGYQKEGSVFKVA